MQQVVRAPAPLLAAKLYRYRWLLHELVSRDLKLRYRGSVLGFAWTLLNPLLFMGVYTLVFGLFLKVGIRHYPLYLLSGVMAWNWFASAILAGTSSIVDGRFYVGKTVFPAELLVLVPVLSNLMNYVFSLPFLIAFVLLFHQPLGLPLLAWPLLVVVQTVLTVALLFFFATFNVFFRDLQQLIAYLVMMMFFLIPIFYSIDKVPAAGRPFVLADPLAIIIMGYQNIFYYNTFPDFARLGFVFVFSLLLLVAGYATFLRYKEAMCEYV